MGRARGAAGAGRVVGLRSAVERGTRAVDAAIERRVGRATRVAPREGDR